MTTPTYTSTKTGKTAPMNAMVLEHLQNARNKIANVITSGDADQRTLIETTNQNTPLETVLENIDAELATRAAAAETTGE